jgi:hypothetical protein
MTVIKLTHHSERSRVESEMAGPSLFRRVAVLGVLMLGIHQSAVRSGQSVVEDNISLTLSRTNPQLVLGPTRQKPPAGLFVCRGPGATPEREVAFPFIDGWLVRPGWKEVEPREGQCDWSLIDKEIKTARRLGKKITLAVRSGPHTPDWVYAAGAKSLAYVTASKFRPQKDAKLPLPWDEVYLRKWTAFIEALGTRFSANDTIVLVHMTNSTSNGLEMQLPSSAADQKHWQEVGYTAEKVIGSWKRVIDVYAQAFPRTPLDVDLHPVLGSDRVAAEVAAHGSHKLGQSFGVFGGWLSGKSGQQDRKHAGMHTLVTKYAALGFAGFQLIGNETKQPERFSPGGIKKAIEQGMGWGAAYFEIWQTDAMNPALHDTLRKLARRSRNRESGIGNQESGVRGRESVAGKGSTIRIGSA